MNELPRQKLCEIITKYGQGVYDDSRRFEGLLRDFCGQYRKEIAVLVGALKDGVPNQLQASKNSVPHVILLAQLSKKLEDNLGLAKETASWAVDSWALALGVISVVSPSKPQKEPSYSQEESHQIQNSAKVNPVTQKAQTQTQPQAQTWQCIMTLTDHAASVRCIAISSDSQILASGSEDRTIKLWHLGSGKLILTINGNEAFGEPKGSWVTSLAISPNGQTIASSNWSSRIVKLWDFNSGKFICNFRGHSDFVYAVAFSWDGQTLVSGSRDKTIKSWNLTTKKNIGTFKAHSDSVVTVALSPEGQTLVSGSRDNTINLWNLPSGKLLRTLRGHSDWVRTVAISPDGKRFASGSSDQTVQLWDLNNGALLHTFNGHSDWINSVAISPDCNTLISVSKDTTLKLWQIQSGKLIETLTNHLKPVCSVAISPDGRNIASGSEDGTIKIWQKT
jgi:WD40 repeat protein